MTGKEESHVDAPAILTAVEPFKAGIGIGLFTLIYGTVKMEFSFGVLGFILCAVAGIVAQLFV